VIHKGKDVAAKLLDQFLIAMYDAIATFYVGFRREAFAAFTGDLESTPFQSSWFS